jgi:flagellar motor protein MotB
MGKTWILFDTGKADVKPESAVVQMLVSKASPPTACNRTARARTRLASNDNEDGQALNRRVELVER